MKILIHTYDTAYQNVAGGVHNRIDRIVIELRKMGIEVDYFDKYHTNIKDYDILHIFKLDIASKELVEYAKKVGVKVIISSIVSINNGVTVGLYWKLRKLPLNTIYKWMFNICDNADSIIVETPKESEYMIKNFHVNADRVYVVPNGVDAITDADNSVYMKLGSRKKYILCLARFDSNKNQINAIRALRHTDNELIFIGGPDIRSMEYYKKCLIEADNCKNIHFWGWLDCKDNLLKSAVSNADIILCPSFQETFGLSIVEGMMAGAIPVISKTLPILGYNAFKNCLTFDPHSPSNIRDKVEEAINYTKDYNLTQEVKLEFSWQSVAKRHVKIYKTILDI